MLLLVNMDLHRPVSSGLAVNHAKSGSRSAMESNDYCSKPIPCLPGPRMTSCPDDFCARPTPCVTVPTQSSCADDYCSKPLPKLCPTPPAEIQESRKRPQSKPVVHQSCHCRSRPFSVVGGESCCQDDYCCKPLPCLTWPQLRAATGCGALPDVPATP